MQKDQSLEKSTNDLSSVQSTEISNSDVDDTIIAGQAGGDINQVAGNNVKGDFIQHFYPAGESKRDRNKSLFENYEKTKTREAAFEQTLARIKELLCELKELIENQIEIQDKKDKEALQQLLDELQEVAGYEDYLSNLAIKEKLFSDAAIWLKDKSFYLVQHASEHVFNQEIPPKRRGIRLFRRQLSEQDLRERFENTIEVYLSWIGRYMFDKGATPRGFRKNPVKIDFENAVYREAFSVILDQIDPEVSSLSEDIANVLSLYITQFLYDNFLDK